MDSGPISPDADALLRRIASFEQLEILLLLHSKPAEWWSLEAIAAGTRMPEDAAADALHLLVRSNLLEAGPAPQPLRFRYQPADTPSRIAVDALASIYQRNSVTILRAMSAHAIERVRNSAIRTFANAFLWKKGEDDHD